MKTPAPPCGLKSVPAVAAWRSALPDEAHYFLNNCFLEDGYILNNMDVIAGKPGIIVQGRHDVICPPHTASDLAKAWPAAELRMVEDAGHSAFESGVLKSLISALAMMANKVEHRI